MVEAGRGAPCCRRGEVRPAVGMGSSCFPAAFALCQCLSPHHGHTSSSPLIKPDVQFYGNLIFMGTKAPATDCADMSTWSLNMCAPMRQSRRPAHSENAENPKNRRQLTTLESGSSPEPKSGEFSIGTFGDFHFGIDSYPLTFAEYFRLLKAS